MAETRRDAHGGPAALSATAEQARNVVLVGPAGSGKTTLMESLLVASGTISRRGSIAHGTTTGDHDPAAVRQKRSVELSVATFSWDGSTITLIDTPGHPDYTGELRAGLRAADAALFVVSATDGIDAATSRLWDECELVGMPRAIVVTGLDRERADFDETIAICQRVFSGGVQPLFLPIHGDDGDVVGFIDLLDERIWHWSTGSLAIDPAEERHRELIASERASLIESVVTESEDEVLMDAFIGGEHVDVVLLTADLERAVARGHFHPVVGHAESGIGIGAELILDLIVRGFPSPLESAPPLVTGIDGSPAEPIDAHLPGPLVAEVIKTTSDPYIGKVSIVRVFSGTLVSEGQVHVSGHFVDSTGRHDHSTGRHDHSTGRQDHDADERIGHLMTLLGKQHRDAEQAGPGSIVAVSKLTRAETGDTLSSIEHPLLMEPWAMPEPMLPLAISPHSPGDEHKLGSALARLVAEDPTLRVEHPEGTGQIVLWTLGEAHADLVLDRLTTRYGVSVDATELQPSMRETFAGPARGSGRLVKQSGGHGQYAVVEIDVEPLVPGSGFVFGDRIVGGSLPRNYIASVEKGVRHQMAQGVAAGFPVVDIRVTLVGGTFHAVDSSDLAFQAAGAIALKDAADKTQMTLLEPIVTLTIDVPDEHVGSVISDLSTRRGIIRGTDASGDGRTTVVADAPEKEVSRYAIDIRSVTHGTGTFTREPNGFGPVPASLAQRLMPPA
jgi:elongation factor G